MLSGMDALEKLFRETSVSSLCDHAQLKGEIAVFTPEPLQWPIYGHWMSMIVVAGNGLRIFQKVFFDSKVGRGLMASASRSFGSRDQAFMLDFVREFQNLSAGAAKNALCASDFKVGLSIPFATRGFDELYFSKRAGAESNTRQWGLSTPAGPLFFSLVVDFTNPAIEQKITWQDSWIRTDDDDLEFL